MPCWWMGRLHDWQEKASDIQGFEEIIILHL
jgi:hypothetical protein